MKVKVKLLKSAKQAFGIEGKRGDIVEVAEDQAELMIGQKIAKGVQATGDLDGDKAGGSTTLVCFIKSPTGAFGLAFNVGEKGHVKDKKLRGKLVSEGFAYLVTDED